MSHHTLMPYYSSPSSFPGYDHIPDPTIPEMSFLQPHKHLEMPFYANCHASHYAIDSESRIIIRTLYFSPQIRQGLVQFSWNLGTGKEVLTVTSISVSDNRWHTLTLRLRDNRAWLSVDERSRAGDATSPGPARSLHTGGILYIGAKIIGSHGSTLESLIPASGFIGCMKDLRYGYLNTSPGPGSDLQTQEVRHYFTPDIPRVDIDALDKDLEVDDKDKAPSVRMAPLPLHTSDSDRMGSHLLWVRNVSFSCERLARVVEPCRSQPCLNGGSCGEERTTGSASSTHRCECPSRFRGDNCEIDLDPCGSTPCLNGGSCIPTGELV